MTALPAGWSRRPLGDIADIQGGIQKQPKRAPGRNAHPFLRVANVTAAGLNLEEVHRIELFDGELARLALQRGDLLVVEGNGSPSQIGRAALWDGSISNCVYQNHLIRVRPREELIARYLELAWNAPRTRDVLTQVASSTSGLYTLSVAKLKRVEVPVPPVAEQRRIVDLLEDHLSRLDAGRSYALSVIDRSRVANASWSERLVWQAAAARHPIGSLLREPMRNGLSARASQDGATRVLTLTAVTKNSFIDEHTKLVTVDLRKAADLMLVAGDILVQRSNTPELVGSAALYDGPDGWAMFPDLMIRLRANLDLVDPAYMALALRSTRAQRYFRSRAKGLAGSMPKIDQGTISELAIPVPPIDEQRRTVGVAQEVAQQAKRLGEAVRVAGARAQDLRRALLEAAFSGRLTGRSTDTAVVEELAARQESDLALTAR